jgi:hypothetical protein
MARQKKPPFNFSEREHEIDLPQVAAQKAKLDAVVDYGSVSRSAWMANYAPGFRAVNQWQALMYAA